MVSALTKPGQGNTEISMPCSMAVMQQSEGRVAQQGKRLANLQGQEGEKLG